MKTHFRPVITSTLILSATLIAIPQSLSAHGTNPSHLDSHIRNPFDERGIITSPPPHHHTLRGRGAHVSLDITTESGSSAEKPVYFEAKERNLRDRLRGRIIEGGRDAPVYSCYADDLSRPASQKGGRLVRVQIEIQENDTTTWVPVGWVIYAHLELTPQSWYNNTVINPGDYLGKVASGLSPDPNCWTGPHVHIEVFNYSHYAGYKPFNEDHSVMRTRRLLCIGGNRPEVEEC